MRLLVRTLTNLTIAIFLFFPHLVLAGGSTRQEAGWEQAWRSLPVLFTPNRGQVNRSFSFVAKAPSVEIWIAASQALIHADGQQVGLEFDGSSSSARVEPEEQTEGRVHYLRGPEISVTDVPIYRGLRIRDLYDGIDLVYGSAGRRLKSNFLVAPRADPSRIKLRYHDADSLRIDTDGSLVITTRTGELRESAPEAFQHSAVGLIKVTVAFKLVSSDSVAFEIGSYDRSCPLLIDPELTYSTFAGGYMSDAVQSIAVDSSGNAYVAGWTESSNFPTQGAYRGFTGSVDAFVAKFNSAGSGLIYATFLGGSSADQAYGIGVDGSGNAYVTGTTTSPNFPVVSAVQGVFGGIRDAFVAKLNSSGSGLVFSTFLGGSGSDNGNGIAVDAGGNAYVVGDTTSTNLPVQSALQSSRNGPQDAFVARVSPAGSLVYSTYYGGSGGDRALGVAVDSAGQVHFGGTTDSANFPVTSGAVQATLGGGIDGFLAKLTAAGTSRVFSTYLGGAGGTAASPEAVNSVAVDTNGNVFAAGVTSSPNFPATTSAFQMASRGGSDAFVAKIDSAGSARIYATFLGGVGTEVATAIQADASGNAYVAGYTSSPDFPTAEPLQIAIKGSYDAFLAKLHPSGSVMLFGTYLGGVDSDAATTLAVDSAGNAYMAGLTRSRDFPVKSAYQSGLSGGTEGFLAKIDTSGAQPPIAQSVTPASGTGLSQAFTFAASDPNGYQTVAAMYGLFQGTGTLTCMFVHRPTTNQLLLLADDGVSWLGPVSLGSATTVQNSACSASGSSYSSSGSGTTVSFSVTISFSAAFAGAKQTRLMVTDAINLSSGWRTLGTWTVGTTVNYVPQAVSVTPSSGSGQSQTFQFVISDENGYQDIRNVAVVINTVISGVAACYLDIRPNTNGISLANDQGTSWTGLTLPGSGSLQNSQCTVSAVGSSVSLSGNTATFSLHLTFQPSFNGARQLYAVAFDESGANSGWVTLGSWTVGAVPAYPATAVSVMPASGTGWNRTFQFVVSDGNGNQDIRNAAIIINNTLSGSTSCYFEVHPHSNRLYLADNSGTSFTLLTLGSPGSVQNSQCSISGTGSSVSLSGNTAAFSINVTFQPSFAGARVIYALAFDQGSLTTGWTTLGSWSVGDAAVHPPSTMSVTPNSGSGRSQTFQFLVSDGNGSQDIRNVAVVINQGIVGSSACYFEVYPQSNRLNLNNDQGNSPQSITLGGQETVQNSQCSISAADSSLSFSGNNVTFAVNITFQPSFAGQRNIYTLAFDQGALNSGWANLGTWIVQ